VRRLLLVNALIFAVLAAVVAFAYFGWANSSAVALQDEQQKLLDALALEKRLNIESNVAEADNRILKVVRLDQVDKLDEQVRSTGAAVASVFVLDDELKPVLNGSISTSRPQAEAVKARDWYVAHEISKLDFAKLPLEKAEHHYGTQPDGTPYLLSYERKLADGKSYYVVVEDDLNHLLNYMIPQFFSAPGFSIKSSTTAVRCARAGRSTTRRKRCAPRSSSRCSTTGDSASRRAAASCESNDPRAFTIRFNERCNFEQRSS